MALAKDVFKEVWGSGHRLLDLSEQAMPNRSQCTALFLPPARGLGEVRLAEWYIVEDVGVVEAT